MAKPEDKTILVVDDEEDVREYLSMVLEDVGFRVLTSEDGNKALEQLKKEVPDFISLDLVMPGKSGMKFLVEMRRNKAWAKSR
jgi:DNA-binding response OmpR family regulator